MSKDFETGLNNLDSIIEKNVENFGHFYSIKDSSNEKDMLKFLNNSFTKHHGDDIFDEEIEEDDWMNL